MGSILRQFIEHRLLIARLIKAFNVEIAIKYFQLNKTQF